MGASRSQEKESPLSVYLSRFDVKKANFKAGGSSWNPARILGRAVSFFSAFVADPLGLRQIDGGAFFLPSSFGDLPEIIICY